MSKLKIPIFIHTLLTGIFLLVFSLLVLFHTPVCASQKNEPKNVLVLYSFRPTQPVAARWDKGVRSVFESNISRKMSLNIEYLDLMHYEDDRLLPLLLDVYRHKYSKPKPDLIIPVFNSAVELMLKHGQDYFPDVPIVFGGVESKFFENRSLGSHTTGYLTDNNYTGTLDLALNLHPDTRDVVVVAGAGPIGRGWSKACREAYKAYEERVNFTYLIGLPLETLLEKVANLSPHTVVISIPINLDGAGKKFFGNESLSHIAQAANAPVYSFLGVTVGTGIVGGYVNSFVEEGKAVAQLGLRILNGEQPEDIPITEASSFVYMFDWQQLRRWDIPENHLPEESIVINRNYTVWDEYWKQITAVMVLVGLQALIIFYLMHLRRRRIKAEQELSSKRAEAEQLQGELAHIGRIGTINALTSALAHEINQPLAAIRSYAQAALRFMDADDPAQENMKIALQGIVSDNKRAADVINRLRDLVKKAEPTREDFDLHATIQNVITLLNSEIVMRGVDISLDLCSDKSVIHADPVYVQQIILNLLVNALDAVQNKPAGTRAIKVSTKKAPEELIISVADSGDGIPADDTDQIFEPFHTTKPEGLGLGLAICKSLVESHHGKIWYKYENDGAVFSFSLPTGENKQVT